MLNKVLLLFCLAVVSACAGPQLPLSKEQPLAVAPDSLVRPPWEAYARAGPGAEKDVDLETLNGPLVAEEANGVTSPVAPVPPPVMSKPGDTVIKAVAVVSVTGVGGSELTASMRKVLKDAGWPVINFKRADALTLQGSAVLDPAVNGQQMVHLIWRVTTPNGKSLGEVKQNNAVPASSLDKGWGENAGFATQAAATGIFKLIDKFR